MKLRWALAGLVLALGVSVPRVAATQGFILETDQGGSGAGLGQNYPNPFGVDTRIPFTVGDAPACTNPSRQYRVSLRIYNLLSQVVSIPVLQSGTGVAGGEPLGSLLLTCGEYVAYWDGSYLNTSQPAPAGIYLYMLEADGRATAKKMFKSR
jgi:hypothetical protein